ncbi:hypothetical protein I4F81_009484 [Pyropia yezoensis]|uniref:Uncharacterized protein n=1 Tax=Pyropia yezoensis TaxID=2788 RepID=A0ACC3C9W7_PYRYE|nr:hypothetical protein I4F81_009484 [Neopyropia yezoensis]
MTSAGRGLLFMHRQKGEGGRGRGEWRHKVVRKGGKAGARNSPHTTRSAHAGKGPCQSTSRPSRKRPPPPADAHPRLLSNPPSQLSPPPISLNAPTTVSTQYTTSSTTTACVHPRSGTSHAWPAVTARTTAPAAATAADPTAAATSTSSTRSAGVSGCTSDGGGRGGEPAGLENGGWGASSGAASAVVAIVD